MPKVLHAGCGKSPLPAWVPGYEIRLDIDPDVNPDIVASITDMGDIGKFEMVYCSHSIEHLYPHDAVKALAEFKRVLIKNGALILIVPNLENIKPDDTVVYVSDAGPITGHDMYYGKKDLIEKNPYMSHKAGYVPSTLSKLLEENGFDVKVCEDDGSYNLYAVGIA